MNGIPINPKPEPSQGEAPPSFLQIFFASPGSALFEVNMSGVTPTQLYALAEYLKLMANNELMQKMNENRIQVPTPILGKDLKGGNLPI